MTIALIIFGSLLSFAAIGSAISKLKKVPDVMAAMNKVGVKPNQVPVLALLEIAGGLGVTRSGPCWLALKIKETQHEKNLFDSGRFG